MGGHKTISCSDYKEPAIIIPDYVVSGVLTPDVTGDYFEDGYYGTPHKYKHKFLVSYIWFYVTGSKWIISPIFGNPFHMSWASDTSVITGTYRPLVGAVGMATVVVGV